MFIDQGQTIYDFYTQYDKLLECPECSKCIRLKKGSGLIYCNHCGHLNQSDAHFETDSTVITRVEGSALGYRLFLKTHVCGHELWAYNEEHLAFMEAYITAVNRRRTPNVNRSLASRLPTWMTSAKNREQVTRGLAALRRAYTQVVADQHLR